METLRDINLALKRLPQQHKPQYYPPTERAGFNYGRALCAFVEALGVDEAQFIRGILKPLNNRAKYLEEPNPGYKQNHLTKGVSHE